MCAIEITGVFGVDIQPDDSTGGIRVEGTAIDCLLRDEYAATPGGPPRARITVQATDVDGNPLVAHTYLTESGEIGFSIYVKGAFHCGIEVRLSVWCGEVGSDCGVEDITHPVVCNPNCNPVTFGPPVVEGCQDGLQHVTITATWTDAPTFTFVKWRWGLGNELTASVYAMPTSSVTLAFAPDDLEEKTVLFELSPGCEFSLDLDELPACCPGPVELAVLDGTMEVVDDPDGLQPGAYTVVLDGDAAVEGADIAWTVTVSDAVPVTPDGTQDGDTEALGIALDDQPVTVAVTVSAPGCPDRDAEVQLVPVVPCPKNLSLVVTALGPGADGAIVDPAECVKPGSYRVTLVGTALDGASTAWTVVTGGTPEFATVAAPHVDVDVDQLPVAVTVHLTAVPPGCPEVDPLSITLTPCDDEETPGGGPPPEEEEEEEDDDDGDTVPPRIVFDWCTFWLIAMFVAMAAGAVLMAIGVCLLLVPEPTTATKWVGAILTVLGFVLLAAGLFILVIWLLTCATIPRNCFLVDILIDVLGAATAVAGIITLVIGVIGSLLGPLCWIGVAIDTAYFGVMLSLAYWFARVVGCRPWPRWVPAWLRVRLPDWMRPGNA